MITRLVKLSLKPEKADEFEAIFYQTQALIESFNGCQKTDLFKVARTESEYFTISYWKAEQDLENYRASALFKSIWAKVKPLFAQKAEAFTLNSVKPV